MIYRIRSCAMHDPLAHAFAPISLETYAHPRFAAISVSLVWPRLEVMVAHPQFPSLFPVYLMNLQPGVWSIVGTPEGQLLPFQLMLDSHAFYVRWLEQDLETVV